MHVPRAKYNLVRIRPAGSALVLALWHWEQLFFTSRTVVPTWTISGHSDNLMHVPRAKYNLVRIRPAGSALVLALLHWEQMFFTSRTVVPTGTISGANYCGCIPADALWHRYCWPRTAADNLLFKIKTKQDALCRKVVSSTSGLATLPKKFLLQSWRSLTSAAFWTVWPRLAPRRWRSLASLFFQDYAWSRPRTSQQRKQEKGSCLARKLW